MAGLYLILCIVFLGISVLIYFWTKDDVFFTLAILMALVTFILGVVCVSWFILLGVVLIVLLTERLNQYS